MCFGDGTIETRRVQSKGKKTDTWYDRAMRLESLTHSASCCVPQSSLVVIEGPSYGSVGGSAHDRSGFWWLLFSRLLEINCEIIPVSPAQRMIYATGSGRASKDQVLAATVKRHPGIDVTGNDEADATLLMAMGKRLLGEPIDGQIPVSHLRAMDKIVRPT